MEHQQILQRNTGFFAFLLSGICAISSGIVVSLLQESYGFSYSMTGTLLSLMSIGNLLSGFLSGMLPSKIGSKTTILLLTCGYAVGYLMMGFSGLPFILMLGFFLVGAAKGNAINTCTILVADNSKNRTKGMNLMHSCYALGALLCPFIIAFSAKAGRIFPMLLLSLFGLFMWLAFCFTPVETKTTKKERLADRSFLKSKKFWIITGLLFCQNGAETSVTGWLVTYFKGNGIITETLSPYTVTVMWGATLIARMLIAFVIPIKNSYSAMIKMSVGCILFYIGLILSHSQNAAILLLFAFAFSMAGMNPTAVASAGRMTSAASMGIMLPAASSGAIIMPWIIGIVAEHTGISTGMAVNILPCIGMLLFSLAGKQLK